MIGQILGPVAGLASSWLDAKDNKAGRGSEVKTYRSRGKSKNSFVRKNVRC